MNGSRNSLFPLMTSQEKNEMKKIQYRDRNASDTAPFSPQSGPFSRAESLSRVLKFSKSFKFIWIILSAALMERK